MKEYEILFILKPNLGEPAYKAFGEELQGWITGAKGEVVGFKPWGIRDLPSTFRKLDKAYYAECQFNGDNGVLDVLNRNLKVKEDAIRHMIVEMDSIIDRKAEEVAKKEK